MVYEIVYMKADYEPWWMFEDWESTIQSRRKFDTLTDAKLYLDELKKEFEAKYKYKEERDDCFFAYWSETERCFCDGCDEDLQIFHGLLALADGKPSRLS
ncbi:DUF1033 family protein [Sporosarcina sp. FSL W8-0480]|uniref:DUF1033 family protein n=1 Tax=Sporosarcina sp. FSL W8-0480 TaxID=2954701 RepID=UPI0030DCE7C8